jgi:hypothetical protein
LVVAAISLGLLGCGGADRHRSSQTDAQQRARARRGAAPSRRPQHRFTAVAVRSIGSLPSAIQDAAIAPLGGGRVALLGGIDASGGSIATITVLAHGSTAGGGTLPVPQHDAQAARLGRYVYVFGGGEFSSYDHILRYDPATDRVAAAGQLPTAASDVAVASLADTAYVVGGYDGASWLDTILAWRPGSPPRVVGRLPVGLRYAAAAAAGDRLLIVGGTTPSGISDAIFSFDPATGSVSRIGRLPQARTHASAAAIGGRVLLIGGRRTLDGGQTRAILSIDPVTGRSRRVSSLNGPLSDAAATTVGNEVVVAGGLSASGAQRELLALTERESR